MLLFSYFDFDNSTIVLIILLFSFLIGFLAFIPLLNKRKQLRRYTQITYGMKEDDMLKIMGNGFNKSILKGNRTKYEWRINAMSSSYKGMRSYTGVRKVDIYCKNGFVEEVKPYNV